MVLLIESQEEYSGFRLCLHILKLSNILLKGKPATLLDGWELGKAGKSLAHPP